jgi:hypothetical protein
MVVVVEEEEEEEEGDERCRSSLTSWLDGRCIVGCDPPVSVCD